MEKQYTIYWCLDGRKNKHECVDHVETKKEFWQIIDSIPFDIIDIDERHAWIDAGDE